VKGRVPEVKLSKLWNKFFSGPAFMNFFLNFQDKFLAVHCKLQFYVPELSKTGTAAICPPAQF
jgi:hypothetical protein